MSQQTFIDATGAKEFDARAEQRLRTNFMLSISYSRTGADQGGVTLFLRPDQIAELFYVLRDADAKYLDPCPICEGGGKVAGDEPTVKIACSACRGSGAVLKPMQVAP